MEEFDSYLENHKGILQKRIMKDIDSGDVGLEEPDLDIRRIDMEVREAEEGRLDAGEALVEIASEIGLIKVVFVTKFGERANANLPVAKKQNKERCCKKTKQRDESKILL